MIDLLETLIDTAAERADYADARYVRRRREEIATRNGELIRLDRAEEEGIGIRVRVGGAWAFAATSDTGRAAGERALAHAFEVAGALPAASGAGWVAEPCADGFYASPVAIDPFELPLEGKLQPLIAADAVLRAAPHVALARARLVAFREHKVFASTEGAHCEQVLTECGGGIAATAVQGDQTATRSYPGAHGGHVAQAGFEHVESLDLPGAAPRIAEEVVQLLTAPPCPARRTPLILAGEQLELQIHESIGHSLELDRVLGREAGYAGTSFVPEGAIGDLRLGSPMLNVTADATVPGGLGSFRWDDEGVLGRSLPLVREGVIQGFLSSRETAAEARLQRSGGCMRAEGFARQPIVRMTNVNLEPGDAGTLDDLISDTRRGVLIEVNRSWSIDSRRSQFRFEGEAAWEIANGRRQRLLRNPSYAGVTPDFWAGLDAVCSAEQWRLGSVLNCLKGEPAQAIHVSHGCAPARFRDIEVGVA